MSAAVYYLEGDIRGFIDDPRFRAYHREFLKTREFNTFDVMRDNGFGWYQVYDREVLSGDELAGMSAHEVNDQVIGSLEDFMGSDETEYRRIEDYFQCLAFTPTDSGSARDDSQ